MRYCFQLRRDVDSFLNRQAGFEPDRGPLPVIFCEFEASGKAVTPHSTARFPHASPACLISISAESVKDDLCIAHEMGHSALYPLHKHNDNVGNLMHEVSGRDYLFRFQVEAFARATYSRAS